MGAKKVLACMSPGDCMIAGKIAGRMPKRNIGDIRDMKAKLDMTLYLVTDSTYHTEESFYKTIEEACQGGVYLVQLREKNCGGREYLEKAKKGKSHYRPAIRFR